MQRALLTGFILILAGCSSTAKALRSDSTGINSKVAVRLAQEFAAKENFNDEFILAKPSKVKRQMTLGQNPHWIWQVYFFSQKHSKLKFYKNTFLMVEVDAVHGTIENWGRR